MSNIKFTKTQLRAEQVKLSQLQKYLPTLQLKKALLQAEVEQAENQLDQLFVHFDLIQKRISNYASLLSDKMPSNTLFSSTVIQEIKTQSENIAGVDIPLFEGVVFAKSKYALFDTPLWIDSAIDGMKELLSAREEIRIVKEKKRLLEKELRDVSIRVNLFEKVMIPRTLENIKKVKIFLGDQQLAAVSQAKVSKRKILQRKAFDDR